MKATIKAAWLLETLSWAATWPLPRLIEAHSLTLAGHLDCIGINPYQSGPLGRLNASYESLEGDWLLSSTDAKVA